MVSPSVTTGDLPSGWIFASSGGASRVGTNDGATRVPRADVNAAEGTTGVHGFDVTIPTALRGPVEVCTAAINVGSGTNTWLACRTVTVAN